MPIVKTLADRVEKFKAKTAPDRVGSRYGAVKDIAVSRYVDNVADITAVRERCRIILEASGVPAGQHGVYYAFVFKAVKAAQSHTGATLIKVIEGLKQRFVAKGADPAILDILGNLVTG